ncbi:hypothetical protein FE810_11600 [Thalassotalea litorea]|uniref:Transcription elongation factor GreAB n=1 Tax=Thalassotalea litorea TaxID=2020715 RepID=A0A5R9IJJ4_9GAMM|nr:hypothetical protein [Thalassotalea litorea]TLU64247.1 hypothetical protein FE810_11600 [Thalassotalea litorea]
MNKSVLVNQLISTLEAKLQATEDAMLAAHAAATDEQSVPETQYDTLGLEASYLALGQSKRLADLKGKLMGLRNFSPRNFTDDDEISAGALITFAQLDVKYFLCPFSSGEVLQDGGVIAISPDSPIGSEIQGLVAGDELKFPNQLNPREITKVE